MFSLIPNRTYCFVVLALLLPACGESDERVPSDGRGGAGGSPASGGATSGGAGGAATADPFELTGVTTKGPIEGASVCVHRWEDGRRGERLECHARTNARGDYGLAATSRGWLWLESEGGTYVDEATGEEREALTLRALVDARDGDDFTAHLTPFSEVAFRLALAAADGGRIDPEDWLDALERVGELARLSSDAWVARPHDLRSNGDSASPQALAHGRALAAFSQFQKERELDLDEAIEAMAEALSSDDATLREAFDESMALFLCGAANASGEIESLLPPGQSCAEVVEPETSGRLNDTGQVDCHTIGDREDLIDCAGSGLDGEFGRDATHPDDADGVAGFSFAKVCHSGELAGSGNCPADPNLGSGSHDWGCTLDLVTGLLWEVKTNDGGFRDVDRRFTHRGQDVTTDVRGYVKAVNAATLCGSDGWRLPHVDELAGLTLYAEKLDPVSESWLAIDLDWFPHTVATVGDDDFEANYWASDLGLIWSGEYEEIAWTVGLLQSGVISDVEREASHALGSARLVRGTPTARPAASRFMISDDELEVTDTATGLTWRRCAEGQTWNGATCAGSATTFSTEAARALAASSDEFRLPNIKELLSLVLFSNEASAQLSEDVFPGSFSQTGRGYLSSTQGPNQWNLCTSLSAVLSYDGGEGIVRLVRR